MEERVSLSSDGKIIVRIMNNFLGIVYLNQIMK
jgi:hypothetical protein